MPDFVVEERTKLGLHGRSAVRWQQSGPIEVQSNCSKEDTYGMREDCRCKRQLETDQNDLRHSRCRTACADGMMGLAILDRYRESTQRWMYRSRFEVAMEIHRPSISPARDLFCHVAKTIHPGAS